MIDHWLPVIGAFVLGIISTVVSGVLWLWNKRRKMKAKLQDMTQDLSGVTENE